VLKIKPDGRAPRVKSNVRTQKRPAGEGSGGGKNGSGGGKNSRAGAGRALDLDADIAGGGLLNGVSEDQVLYLHVFARYNIHSLTTRISVLCTHKYSE
jgi:hypothetical protein